VAHSFADDDPIASRVSKTSSFESRMCPKTIFVANEPLKGTFDAREEWVKAQMDGSVKRVDAAKARRVLLGGACATSLEARGCF
jgi:hypothetical protein